MSGAATAGWIGATLATVGTAASIDQAKSAKHQGRLQAQQQAEQFAQAQQLEQQKLEQAERLAQQQLEAQQRAQAASISQAQRAQAASIAQAQRAQAESKALMDKQLKAADENMNRATQKRPNTARIVDEAAQAGKAGASGTMLTGPQGVDPGVMQLGKTTLLGQ